MDQTSEYECIRVCIYVCGAQRKKEKEAKGRMVFEVSVCIRIRGCMGGGPAPTT